VVLRRVVFCWAALSWAAWQGVAAGAIGAGAVALVGAAEAVGAGAVSSAGVGAAPAAVPPISGHFALRTVDGREVTDATWRGKWLLVYFGYTSCPDICPTVLLRVGQALDALGPLASRVQPIFITVDPERDTDQRLATYVAAFNSRVVGLRGDPGQIREAAREFHVYYRARSLGNGEYTVDHSSFLYLVAPDGQFTKLLADSLPVARLTDELRAVVR
jgi:protein SCO1